MSAPAHRDDVRRTVIGLVTVGVGAIIAYVGMTVQGGGELPLKDYTSVTADFADVGTLKPQQRVTENGVRIGQVSAIEYADGLAKVTLRLDGERKIYQDAAARIGNESALGKKYIDFDPGTPGAGELDDAAISVDQTRDAADLDDVLEAFDPAAREGLATGLTELGGGLRGHGTDLNDAVSVAPELLADGATVLHTLSAPATNLDDMLVTADSLVAQFKGQSDQIGTLLDEAEVTLKAVNVDGSEPLQETLAKLPAVLRTARGGLAAINGPLADTASAVTALRPGVGHLVAATPDLRGFLVESPPVAETVVTFTGEAEPALEALTPAIVDARPLVQRLARTLGLADPFLSQLSPYIPDAGRMVGNHDLLSGHFSPTQHYFSAQVALPGIYNLSLPDPLADTDPYPGPGNAFGGSNEK